MYTRLNTSFLKDPTDSEYISDEDYISISRLLLQKFDRKCRGVPEQDLTLTDELAVALHGGCAQCVNGCVTKETEAQRKLQPCSSERHTIIEGQLNELHFIFLFFMKCKYIYCIAKIVLENNINCF